MKTIPELLEAVRNGQRPVVTFRKEIENKEGYAELGMRARVVGAKEKVDVVSLTFDFSDFEEHNKTLESTNYYDKSGNPTLTAREAGYYKPQESYYFDTSESPADFFDYESESRTALYKRFKASGATCSYVSWLEDLVQSQEAAS